MLNHWLILVSSYFQKVQAADRALLVDILPKTQQELGNAWAGRMLGVGSVFGFFLCALNLSPQLVVHSILTTHQRIYKSNRNLSFHRAFTTWSSCCAIQCHSPIDPYHDCLVCWGAGLNNWVGFIYSYRKTNANLFIPKTRLQRQHRGYFPWHMD